MLSNLRHLLGLLLMIGLVGLLPNIGAKAQMEKNISNSKSKSESENISKSDGVINISKGIKNVQQARQDWTIQCQGCHGVKAKGFESGTPRMNGQVSKFLGLEGGRAYLAQVPGVANAPLSNARLANVMNWTLVEFDPKHIPADSAPYTADEIGLLRKTPLFLDSADVRQNILSQME